MATAPNLFISRTLIFLMVFIALPALQRSQRDTQRRNDLARITEAITQYQTNNNGRLPADQSCTPEVVPADQDGTKMDNTCNFIKRYLNATNAVLNTYKDPSGETYSMEICSFGDKACALEGKEIEYNHIVYVVKGGRCNDSEGVSGSDNSRDYAVLYALEGSGTYCQGNNDGASTKKTPTNP